MFWSYVAHISEFYTFPLLKHSKFLSFRLLVDGLIFYFPEIMKSIKREFPDASATVSIGIPASEITSYALRVVSLSVLLPKAKPYTVLFLQNIFLKIVLSHSSPRFPCPESILSVFILKEELKLKYSFSVMSERKSMVKCGLKDWFRI